MFCLGEVIRAVFVIFNFNSEEKEQNAEQSKKESKTEFMK